MKELHLDHRDVDEVWQEFNRLWWGMGGDMVTHLGWQEFDALESEVGR